MSSQLGSLIFLILLTKIALAVDLTTINPCPQDPSSVTPITVTAQYQPVSTCYPQVENDTTSYSYSTYNYVSTEIPCAFDGEASSSVLVTDTAQWVTVTTHVETTSTVSWVPSASTATTVYQTYHRQGLAPYNKIGRFAMPGWHGCGLCVDCNWQQDVRMQACHSGNGGRSCWEYDQTWVSDPAPTATAIASACATSTVVASAGTYTWGFPQSAATVTVTVPAQTVTVTIDDSHYSTTVKSANIVTVTQSAWTAYVTSTCYGPTTFDFTTTITKTSTATVPYVTISATVITPVISPPVTGFPVPAPATATSSNANLGSPVIINTTPAMTTATYAVSTYMTTSGGSTFAVTQYDTFTGTVIPTSLAGAGSPVLTGTFVTLTAVPTSGTGGALPTTITLATPSGTSPGTVGVFNPSTGLVQADAPISTGATVSLVVQASGSVTPSDFATLTLATSSGTVPGTVELIPSSLITATGTGSGLTTVTLNPTSTGLLGAADPQSLGGLPTTTSAGLPFSLATNIVGGGNTASTTPCVGLLCASAGVSAPIGGITATAVVGGSSTLLDVSVGDTVTAILGGVTDILVPASTSCDGLICVSVGASVTNIVGATVTAVVGESGTLVDVGAGASITGVAGATITAVVGASGTLVDISLAPSITGIGSIPVDIVVATGTADCPGLLCASASAAVSGVADASVTAVVLGTSTLVDVGVGASITGVAEATITAVVGASGTLVDVSLAPSITGIGSIPVDIVVATGTAACPGLLCASAAASVSGVADATLTAVVLGTSTLVDVSLGASVPIVGPVTATAVVGASGTLVDVAASVPLTGLGVSATIPVDVVVATGTAACPGVLCASAAASVTGVADLTATAVVLSPSTAVALSAGVSVPVVGTASVAVAVGASGVSVVLPVSVTLPAVVPGVNVLKRDTPTTMLTSIRAVQGSPKTCYQELNICTGFDLGSLFATQQEIPRLRVNRAMSNGLDIAFNGCQLADGCRTYGVTKDGLMGLTSPLGIDTIKNQVDAYARTLGGVCDNGMTVRLYANDASC